MAMTRRVAIAQAVALVVGVVLLRLRWSSIEDVVRAIDHGDVVFTDFVYHYYPTVSSGPLRHSGPAGGFFYPAAFAAFIAPIGWLSLASAKIVWGAVQLGCLLWCATLLVREVTKAHTALAALGTIITVTSVPILHNLKWGQVSLLILAAAGGAFVAYRRGRHNLAAILLGVAAGIKGYPLVFLGWFVARGDLKFTLRAAGACLVTLVLLPAIVMGPEHAMWFQRVSTNSVMGAADGVLRDFNSQYAPAVLSRFYEGGWDFAPTVAMAWGKLGSGAALVVIALLVGLAARSTAPRIAAQRDMLGFVLIACSTPFWLRTSWSHYFVHLPLAYVLLATSLAKSPRYRGREALALGLLVAPSAYLSSVLGLFATEGWWFYANAGSLFFANALVLLALAAFVVEAHVSESVFLARRHTAASSYASRTAPALARELTPP
jgi:hypothetical protein